MSGHADVLVVDDDADIRTLIATALRLEGWTVAEADGGIAGLDHLRTAIERPPDVVVLDVQMPDLDGWEVLGQVRATEKLSGTAVVLCTVRAGAADRDRGQRLGADAYITKPFDVEGLVGTVARLIECDRPGRHAASETRSAVPDGL
jgi:two-component system OmpR family response regulator